MDEQLTPVTSQQPVALTSQIITPLTDDDYNSERHIVPEARERIIGEIQKYIRVTGKYSVQGIQQMLGVQWVTAQSLIKAAAERALAETDDIRAYQVQYYTQLIEDVRENWQQYGITTKRDEEEVLANYFKKIDDLLRLKYTPDQMIGAAPGQAINTALFQIVSPEVAEFARRAYRVETQPVGRAEDVVVDVESASNVTNNNESLPPVTNTTNGDNI